jgi:hypothetical protein
MVSITVAITAGLSTLLISVARADFTFSQSGHTYLAVTTPLAWTAAAADATSQEIDGQSGSLARIDDQAENDAIIAALLANIPSADFSNTDAIDGGGGAYVWLGATDRVTEGVWHWDGDADGAGDQFWQGNQNGNPVGGLYNNWGRGTRQNEPDNFFFMGSDQDAAGISLNGWPLGSAGQWNDVALTNALYYLVEFAPSSTESGDYNDDGVVDAADYTVWRDTLGSNENLSADGNANLMIDAGDYDVWVGHFGSVLGGAAVAAIDTAPEPSAIWLLALAGTAMAANGVRRRFSGRPAG